MNHSYRILSGSALKVIAMVTMLIDHLGGFLFVYVKEFNQPLFVVGHKQMTICLLMHFIGRLSFPIFCFLLVEGFQHTRNRWKYGRNLLLFAIISELPFNLVHGGSWHCPIQNVFFTLFLGYLGLCAIENYRDNRLRQALALIGLLALSVIGRVDYGCSGYGLILLLYALRRQRLLQAVIGSCILNSRWIAGLAFIPINMYNGRRGFIQGPIAKYAFYVFYPLHLFIIYLMQMKLLHVLALM